MNDKYKILLEETISEMQVRHDSLNDWRIKHHNDPKADEDLAFVEGALHELVYWMETIRSGLRLCKEQE